MSLRASSSSSSSRYSTPTSNGGILDSLIASLVSSNQDLTLTESELDRLISDAILQESRDRNASGSGTRESAGGPSAPEPSRAASTNKRFLAGVIRGVEGHNRAVIKRGLKEALEGEKRRRRTEAQGNARDSDFRNATDVEPTRRRHDGTHSGRHSREEGIIASSSRSTLQSEKPQQIPSKMDKYFSSSYDPSLDIAPEHSTHSAQQGKQGWGLIEDGGWDTLLDRAKARDEEKRHETEERKTRRNPGREEKDPERSRRRDDKVKDNDRDSASERRRGHAKEESSRRRHRDRSASPRRSRSPRRDRESQRGGRRSHRDGRSDSHSRSRSRSSSPSRTRKSRYHQRHRHHSRSRDGEDEERHRSRHSRRNRSRSPSRSRSASPEQRHHRSHRHRHRSKADKDVKEAEATEVGSSALDTKYAPRGSVREWDLGKSG